MAPPNRGDTAFPKPAYRGRSLADIRPFQGLRYGPGVGADIGALLCPPYDIISPADQEHLHSKSPLNAVRLEAPRPSARGEDDGGPYVRSARQLDDWLREGVLISESESAYYLTEEAFPEEVQGGARVGLYARVRLEEYERGVVLPHEHTRAGPKEDRLRLMQATQANLSPLMSLYRDDGTLGPLLATWRAERPPDYAATMDDGTRHRVWVLRDPALHGKIHDLFADRPIYMADGHHRYETALSYRNERREQPGDHGPDDASEFVMMSLVDIADPGLLLLAFHRLVSGLSRDGLDALRDRVGKLFTVEPRPGVPLSAVGLSDLLAEVVSRRSEAPTLGMLDVAEGRFSLLTLRSDLEASELSPAPTPDLTRCEPWLLHHEALDSVMASEPASHVEFVHDLDAVASASADGQCQAVFLVPPMDLDLFEALVRQGQRLPPKSTYFAPKLPTGLVMNPLWGSV